jgi:hypothetical protein
MTTSTNPLLVEVDAPRLLWGDLHGHSNLSDGSGAPDAYYAYARDVAGVDVAALTDHDHFGAEPQLDEAPGPWSQIRAAAAHFHVPRRFVALFGLEWTSWLHGHRHVLYFADEGPVLSSLDARFDTPPELWAALRGQPVLTVPHHPAGGPTALNWAFAPDPELEPLVEIVSAAGSSESADGPRPVRDWVAGHFVRDALDGGDRLGFLGSGDTHDGHPGCPGPDERPKQRCGLVGIYAEERTRESVLAALRARRCFASNGPRVFLDVRLGGAPMGATVAPADALPLAVRVVAPRPIQGIEVVRSGAIAETIDGMGLREQRVERRLAGLRSGEYVYVRLRLGDDRAAWSSPFFVE